MPAGRAMLLALLVAQCATAGSPARYEVVRDGAASDEQLLSAGETRWSLARNITWGEPRFATTFRALAGRDALFLRFDVTDAHPWSTRTQRDARLWSEEVVEIFIARPVDRGEYVELQINPANVVADLRIDLARRNFDPTWNFAGLETRVHALRNAGGNVTGWCVVAKLPWSGFDSGADARADSGTGAPIAGERWRFNVFRIERPGGREQPEQDARFLAWSPTGSRSFHVPEAFGELVFR